jgi:protein-S-isoprenylcysteine O-methyltransferase Ste14
MTPPWLALIGVVLFLGVLGWRSWWQRHRYGSRGVLLFRSRRWQDRARDAMGVVLVLLLGGQAVVGVASPASLGFLGPPDSSVAGLRLALGALLLLGGIALLVIAQLDLGASWRIGIEEGARPGLVTDGIYRFCRNPIFLAILITLAGYTVLLPTHLSLLLLAGAFVGIRQQVLAEETFLGVAYGDAYRAYARRVGRFLPGIGRLRG